LLSLQKTFVAVALLSHSKELLNEDKKRFRPYIEGRKRYCFRGTTFVCRLAQLLALLSQGGRLCFHNCSEVGSVMGAGDVTSSKCNTL